MNSVNTLLILVLFSNVALNFLENVGFIFRSAGFVSRNAVAGYTLQNSLGFISRIFSFILVPAIAWLADNGSVHLNIQVLLAYYALLLILLYLCCFLEKEIIHYLSSAINAVQNQGSLLGLMRWKSIKKLLLISFVNPKKSFAINVSNWRNVPLSKRDLRVVSLFSICYVPYYSAWK